MNKENTVLVFDHGPIGYLSIAAHGHADALAVWLSVGRQPVIVDAGTYLYHSSRTQRDWFRDTTVHNTLTLNHVASSRPSGPFNWATKANSRLVSLQCGPLLRIVAEHDGYVSQYGVTHRRTVEFDGAARFTFIDELLGALEEKDVAISFLLDPTCQSTLEPNGSGVLVTVNPRRPIARFVSVGPLKATILRADEHSGCGWVSPSFGVRLPADQVLFHGSIKNVSKITIDLL
jgi:hypothetical protein